MPERKWPFPGDAPVTRARKMALAYRQRAERLEARHSDLRKTVNELLEMKNLPVKVRGALLAVALDDAKHETVEGLDTRFLDWGETWHTPIEATYDLDDWVSAKIGGQLIQIPPATLTTLRMRRRITGRWAKGKGVNPHWEFKVRDLYALQDEIRKRGTILGKTRAELGNQRGKVARAVLAGELKPPGTTDSLPGDDGSDPA